MTKGELMNLVYGEDYTNIDSALPQPWVDATSLYGLQQSQARSGG
jgi:hypothetical protein